MVPTCGSSYLLVRYLQPLDGIGQYGMLYCLLKILLADEGKMNSDFVCNWCIIGDESQDRDWIHLPKDLCA